MSVVGERLKLRRTEKGVSVSELARRVGVSKGYLHTIENGETNNPSADIVLKLARELGTTFEDLLGQPELPPRAIVSPTLLEFAAKYGLTADEIDMLSVIHYRGKRPETVHDWWFMWEGIKRSLS